MDERTASDMNTALKYLIKLTQARELAWQKDAKRNAWMCRLETHLCVELRECFSGKYVHIENLKFLYGSGMQTFSVCTGGIKEDLFDNLWTVIEGNKVSFLVSDLLSVLQAKEKVYNETRS